MTHEGKITVFALANIMTMILGEKLKMSQDFNLTGRVVPLTLIKILPSTVTLVKTLAKDGYQAVQIGASSKKHLTKPLRGHLKGLGDFRYLKEFPYQTGEEYQRGQRVDISIFQKGDKVKVSGISKGKGFQGVVKRHGFHGSPASHGHKDQLRMPGSIGSKRLGPVAKGKRMAGRMGGQKVTVHNLEIFELDKINNLLYLKGAVPGVKGGLLLISKEK